MLPPFVIRHRRWLQGLLVFTAVGALGGCAVVAVADAVVTVGATVVKTGVKATGAVVDALIPDGKSK